jgi:hypothetical protein
MVLLATVAVIGLGCSSALADMMDVQAIGTPELGDSWSQIFAFRAGEWDTFNKLTFEITSTNYTFELYQPGPPTKGPSLGSFRDLETKQANLNNIKSDTSDTKGWVLNSETSKKAVASGGGIGGEFYWLEIKTTFNEDALPTNDNKLGFRITVDTTSGDQWWREGNFWKTETGAVAMSISEEGITVIPAPAAVVLGVLGLALVGWLKRRVA